MVVITMVVVVMDVVVMEVVVMVRVISGDSDDGGDTSRYKTIAKSQGIHKANMKRDALGHAGFLLPIIQEEEQLEERKQNHR